MDNYEENLHFSQKFCNKYNDRDIEEFPALKNVKIMLSQYEKHPNFMIIFSHQTPNHMKKSTKSTIIYLIRKKNEFLREFKLAFQMYYSIGLNSNGNESILKENGRGNVNTPDTHKNSTYAKEICKLSKTLNL